MAVILDMRKYDQPSTLPSFYGKKMPNITHFVIACISVQECGSENLNEVSIDKIWMLEAISWNVFS